LASLVKSVYTECLTDANQHGDAREMIGVAPDTAITMRALLLAIHTAGD
jgi:hypothetical protein